MIRIIGSLIWSLLKSLLPLLSMILLPIILVIALFKSYSAFETKLSKENPRFEVSSEYNNGVWVIVTKDKTTGKEYIESHINY